MRVNSKEKWVLHVGQALADLYFHTACCAYEYAFRKRWRDVQV
jgi:hypothetical protein